jgi:hypothetical protein
MALGPLAPGGLRPPVNAVAAGPRGIAVHQGPTHAERMAHVRNLLAAALIHHQAAMDAAGAGGPGGPPGMGPPGMGPPGMGPPGGPAAPVSNMPSVPGGMVGRPSPAFPFGGRR